MKCVSHDASPFGGPLIEMSPHITSPGLMGVTEDGLGVDVNGRLGVAEDLEPTVAAGWRLLDVPIGGCWLHGSRQVVEVLDDLAGGRAEQVVEVLIKGSP